MSSISDGFAELDKEFVVAIARAMTVLEAFDAKHPEMTLSEIAALTGISPATVRRCLHTLQVLGYIRQGKRQFRLGPRVLTFSQSYVAANRIEDLVQRELQLLVETFNDPSSVAVLDGSRVVYVATVARPSSLRPSAGIGTRYPAHATSLGKVILAFSDVTTRATYLARANLEAPTDRTINTATELAPELAKIAAQGFAVSIDELDYGVASIAVPIFNAQGKVVAAVNSSGYSGRLTQDTLITGRLQILKNCAQAISLRIGDNPLALM